MARSFNGSTDYIACAAAGAQNIDGGAMTLAAIVKPDSISDGGVIVGRRVGDTTAFGLVVSDPFWYLLVDSSPMNILDADVAEGWVLVAVSKASGTATPRAHKYVYSSNTWTHVDGGFAMADGAALGSTGTVDFGALREFTEFLDGHIDRGAVWDRVLTDAEIEQLPFSQQAWYASAPVAGMLLDQSTTGQKVVDWTGGGANESAISGTSVSDQSVPVISSGHDVVVPHSVPAAGGTNANAEDAAGTGAAQAPSVDAAAAPPPATTTGTAQDPQAALAPAAGNTAGTAAAQDPTVSTAAAADAAAGSGAAADASTTVTANADCATATAAANDATVSTAAAANANAESTTGSGSAADPATAVEVAAGNPTATAAALDGSAQAGATAENASGTAASNTATASIVVNGDVAAAAGAALDATVSTTANANAPADVAGATGAANTASAAVTTPTGLAAATATANAAVADVGGNPAEGSAAGQAPDVSITLAFGAEVATTVGAAFDATVLTGGPGIVNAGVAAAAGSAFNATVSKRIPRSNTGVVVRPNSGVIVRPNSGVILRP